MKPQFIKSVAIAIAPTHCRLIVSGDKLQILGTQKDSLKLVQDLVQKLKDTGYPDLKIDDVNQEKDYHLFRLTDGSQLTTEVEFIQTEESPFDTYYTVVKSDGSTSKPQKFDTTIVNQEDVIFEAARFAPPN